MDEDSALGSVKRKRPLQTNSWTASTRTRSRQKSASRGVYKILSETFRPYYSQISKRRGRPFSQDRTIVDGSAESPTNAHATKSLSSLQDPVTGLWIALGFEPAFLFLTPDSDRLWHQHLLRLHRCSIDVPLDGLQPSLLPRIGLTRLLTVSRVSRRSRPVKS